MLDPTFTIPTPRLTLSRFSSSNPSHTQFIHTLYNSPEMLYINSKVPGDKALAKGMDPAACQEFINKGVKMMEKSGFGRYLVSLKESSEPIGLVALQLERHPGAPTIPDLGFALLAAHYGKGYATEASSALLEYYRNEKGVTQLCDLMVPSNEASMKMFRRLGFECRGEREVMGIVGEGVDVKAVVWTMGIDETEEDLVAVGL